MNHTGGREGVRPVAASISGALLSRDMVLIMNQKLDTNLVSHTFASGPAHAIPRKS
ncbi:hypothetical protein HMPREF0308_1382 [Corynebacterium striatum ATCC 6940]|nr:hypothetical protein HMPREF0308_1382 [Corynebacterium striatum ATCC 6940]